MNDLLCSYFYVALISVSILSIIELLINFIGSINLKLIMISILLNVFMHSILGVLHFNEYDNKTLIFLSRLFHSLLVSILFFVLFRVDSKNLILKIFKFSFLCVLMFLSILIVFKSYFKIFFQHYNLDISIITLLRSITGFILLGYMGIIIYMKFGNKHTHAENLYSKKIYKWSICILSIIGCNAIGNLVRYITGVKGTMFEIDVVIGDYITVLAIMFRPNYLNRAFHSFSFSKKLNSFPPNPLPIDDFVFHFFTNTYYLNSNASTKEFSLILNFSQDELSDFVIKFYRVTFIDLVNKSRIDYFIDLVNSGYYNQLTIEALGQKAGFGSRQNLYRSFKKYHGGNPSDLLKKINNSQLKQVVSF